MSKEAGKHLFYDEEDGTDTEGAGRVYLQVSSDKKTNDKEGTSVVKLEDTTLDEENESAEDGVRADEDTLHEDNVEVIHEVAAERNRPPSPRDGRLPGAFHVLGPDYDQGEEVVTVISSSSVTSPSTGATANVAVLAQLVDGDEENRILNQRIEEALQEERDRAAVAEVVPEPIDSSWKKRRWAIGGIVFLMIATAIIVASVVSTQEKQSPPTLVTAPPPSPTLSTQAPPVAESVERLQEDGFEMDLVGMKPLDSKTQSLWKEVTELFIFTRIVDEVFPDDVRVTLDLVSQDPPPFESRRLQALQSDELTIKFDAEIFITSGVEDYTAFDYIFGAFDSPEEQSAYIEAFKAKIDPISANLTSVQVAVASAVGNPLVRYEDQNLTISLFGVTTLSTDSWVTFNEIYTAWCDSFYESFPQFDIDILGVDLEFVSQNSSSEELVLVFNLNARVAKGDGLGASEVFTQPFLSENSRNLFATELRESGDPAFANIRGVSALTGVVEY